MGRIGLAVVLALSLVLAPFTANAQRSDIPRIGYLVLSPLVDPPLLSAKRSWTVSTISAM